MSPNLKRNIQIGCISLAACVAFAGLRQLPQSSCAFLKYTPSKFDAAGMEFCGDTTPAFIELSKLRPSTELRFVQTPKLRAGQGSVLHFELIGYNARRLMPHELAITHTQLLHLVLIDESLGDYHHIHPTPEASGSWSFEFTPRTEGVYRLIAEYVPLRTRQSLSTYLELNVSPRPSSATLAKDGLTRAKDGTLAKDGLTPAKDGRATKNRRAMVKNERTMAKDGRATKGIVPASPMRPAATLAKNGIPAKDGFALAKDGLTPAKDGWAMVNSAAKIPTLPQNYTLALQLTPLQARRNFDNTLTLKLTEKSGRKVQLEPVMGAYAHLLSFDAGNLGYAHLHPSYTGKETQNSPELSFVFNTHKAGRYRLWAQLKLEGKERFIPFDIHVAP